MKESSSCKFCRRYCTVIHLLTSEAAPQVKKYTEPGAWPAVGLCVCRDEPPSAGGDVVAPEVVEVLVAVPAAEEVQGLGGTVEQHLQEGRQNMKHGHFPSLLKSHVNLVSNIS